MSESAPSSGSPKVNSLSKLSQWRHKADNKRDLDVEDKSDKLNPKREYFFAICSTLAMNDGMKFA